MLLSGSSTVTVATEPLVCGRASQLAKNELRYVKVLAIVLHNGGTAGGGGGGGGAAADVDDDEDAAGAACLCRRRRAGCCAVQGSALSLHVEGTTMYMGKCPL